MGRMSAMIVGLVMLVGTAGVATNEAEGFGFYVSNRTLDKKLDWVLDNQTEILDQLAGLQQCPANFAPLAQTGQKDCWDPTGNTDNTVSCADTRQDGDLRKGVAWPVDRYTNNGDGTVTDNLTGLKILEDWNCLGNVDWETALTNANSLADGTCGLTDGSVAGVWRLPNRIELQSLLNLQFASPAVSNTAGTGKWTTNGEPFKNVQSQHYWSSTTDAFPGGESRAWYVSMNGGDVLSEEKGDDKRVLAVSGGDVIW